MTEHIIQKSLVLRERLLWIPTIILGVVLFYFVLSGESFLEEFPAVLIAVAAGLYAFYLLSDAEGFVRYNEEGIVCARIDIGEVFSGKWDGLKIDRLGKKKYRLTNTDGLEFILNPSLYQNGEKLKAVLEKHLAKGRTILDDQTDSILR